MSTWKDFEIDCTNYLNKQFCDYAIFSHQGEEDSTVPDILVETQSGNKFYIEAKHSPAQCGQFVLNQDENSKTFIYSNKNASRINTYAQRIMEVMNLDFDGYKNAGTAGKSINFPNAEQTFVNWIVETYRHKKVKFFITNDYTILPLEKFGEYFNVTAKYRIKRSGSSSVGKSRLAIVSNYISSHHHDVINIRVDGNKLFVQSPSNLHETHFIISDYEYMFSLRGSEYEIRKLSNTKNANVIFSIQKKKTKGMSNSDFINYLK